MQINTLLPELRKLVVELAEDLLERSTTDATTDAGLRDTFAKIEEGGRTAQAFETWRDDYLDQVAVAWVLGCVFVRFMEDNELIDECWLAGEGERRLRAEESHELFVSQHPLETDREYFYHVFHTIGDIPAARDLFAKGKTPLWAVGISGDAAMRLREFWREIDPATGQLLRPFKVENGDTRFLGDLYQDLSEKARKKYALLQTPVFVEEFILDRTLTPALDEFGLEKVRMIDPTCGSGHFLLGAFARLYREWSKPEHSTGNPRKDVQNALDGVWGVDINPFAVAIARFRLIVAATVACGEKRFRKNGDGWTLHLAAGDSLLFGKKYKYDKRETLYQMGDLFATDPIYAVEEPAAVQEILGQAYHVVVGNPPYIIVRDRSLNATYRQLYSSCHQKYSLGVPFTQRFWELAIQQSESSKSAGFVGEITANSFMKREFGKKLIEEYFKEIDLTHVIDTSGAYIPGHGTPTVILFGRARSPVGESVRAVLGIKGEPSAPDDASKGLVWQSILNQVGKANMQDNYTSSTDIPRSVFNKHPWSIGGGGASDVKSIIEDSEFQKLGAAVDSIGITCFTLEDDVYIMPWKAAERCEIHQVYLREMVVGDMVRDWASSKCDPAIFAYNSDFSPIQEDARLPLFVFLWNYKTSLSCSVMFGGKTKIQAGLKWYEYGRLTHSKLKSPLSITFAEVATHNHFVLDRGDKVYKQTAPIIKLPANATEDDHLALVGLLNSSAACFWLKQSCHNKGSTVDQRGARQRTDAFEDFYQLNGTRVGHFPVSDGKPLSLSRRLDEIAGQLGDFVAERLLKRWAKGEDLKTLIEEAEAKCGRFRRLMIALQEELDWECYRHYALLNDDLCYRGDDLPELNLGERAFEIVMARHIQSGELQTTWFERHASKPIAEIPTHWPTAYQTLVERRIKCIEKNKEIALIEKPEYKRRWNTEPWAEQVQRAFRNWLLDRLETPAYQHGAKEHPELTTVNRMADIASADAEFLQVAELFRGRAGFDVTALVAELVEAEAVPFLPVLRYKPAGLRKREVWERTWELQRQEDAGKEVGTIPVPPKYTSADFLKSDFWRLRGKLDVPKERWISYPHCSADNDASLVVAWAGLNHLEQARALVSYYDDRKLDGWSPERLKPLLAGLDQLLPWIHQWHPEIDPAFGETPGNSFQTLLEQDAHELGLTLEEIRAWVPPAKVKKAKATKTTKKKKVEEEEEE